MCCGIGTLLLKERCRTRGRGRREGKRGGEMVRKKGEEDLEAGKTVKEGTRSSKGGSERGKGAWRCTIHLECSDIHIDIVL